MNTERLPATLISHMEIFVVINFILTIYLLTKISSIERRVKKDSQYTPQQVENITPTQVASATVSPAAVTPTSTEQASVLLSTDGDDALSKAFAWLKEDWMLKLGGFFMLLAAGWFVTYAFMNNWIGETGRIVLGILAGSAFMTWGVLRMKKVMREGEVILSIGAIILTTSVFAGQHMYNLYPDTVSLAAMTFVAIAISTIAYIHKREILALFGVLMIGATPILAGYDSVTPNVPGLLTYLLCMTLGVIWLSKVTGWRSVTFVSIAVVALYFAPYCMKYKEYMQMTTARTYGYYAYSIQPKLDVDVDVLRFFAIVFAIIFNMSTFVSLLFNKIAKRDDFILVATGGIFTAFCLYTLSTHDLLAIKLVVVAMLYMGLAIALTKMTKYSYYVELYSTICILLLVWATSITSDINLLPTALSIEAIILTLFYKYVFGQPFPIVSLLFYGGSYLLCFIFIADFGRTAAATISFITTAISTYFPYLLVKKFSNTEYDRGASAAKLSLIFGNILVSLGLYTFVENVGQKLAMTYTYVKGIRYALYAMVGSFLYFMSRAPGKHAYKNIFGLIFIGYAVASLLLYEVWMMDIAARIIIFFLIGLLFISSIYFIKMYEKKN